MFNFCVVFAGHDMVTDAGRATTRRRKFKAPSLKSKSIKKCRTFRKHEFLEKTRLKLSTQKKENTLLAQSKQPRGTHSLQKQRLKMALIKSKN